MTESPAGLRFLRYLVAPLTGGVTVAVLNPVIESPRPSLGETIFFGVFFTAWMTLTLAVVHRRAGVKSGIRGIHNEIAVTRAFRTGEPPADTSLDAQLLALIERRRESRWEHMGWLLIPAGIEILCVVFAVSDRNLGWLLLAALNGAVFTYLLRRAHQGLAADQRRDRLESALRDRRPK
jgi:hypothetical protein